MLYASTMVVLDTVELEYLLELVERDLRADGALIGLDVQGNLLEAQRGLLERSGGNNG